MPLRTLHRPCARLLCVILILLAIPQPAGAAPIEFTASVRANLDKTMDTAAPELAASLSKTYDQLAASVKTERSLDQTIKSLQYSSEEALLALRKQIQQVGASRIASAKKEVEQIKQRYKPLLALYDSLAKQAAAAKSFGQKELAAALRSQADQIKPAVQVAKQDIKNREAKLKAARTEAAERKKRLRGMLAGMDAVKLKKKAERSAVSSLSKSLAAEWGSVKQSLRKRDAVSSHKSLSKALVLSGQVNTRKQTLHSLEQSIADIIRLTGVELARYSQ
ncbi:hypothetical protein DNH61_12695 [Paenibacillus sambharensis]|uniref:Uncharacterized protein n=1 Tax=Paenibacillus sambharensis TaxID=1803190 RepID=A0A2W1LB89_9BACL|nr:hypothetical protein [Paenibacillus sambharensis]PZD95390.1 hypothetical protein DNH61_12695 [Paenibacillus sambharensis]